MQQSAYLEFLPAIFHNQEFLGRFLFGFENLWELMEWRQDHIEMYFDPRTAPAAFLDWLVQWLDIAMDRHWPEPRKRDFITRAVELYRWRGTSSGLREMIHTCTGHYPEIDEINAFTFRILFDKDAAEHRDFIEDLIQMHKPAHAGYVLEFA